MLLMLQNSGRFLPMHLLDAAKTHQKKNVISWGTFTTHHLYNWSGFLNHQQYYMGVSKIMGTPKS